MVVLPFFHENFFFFGSLENFTSMVSVVIAFMEFTSMGSAFEGFTYRDFAFVSAFMDFEFRHFAFEHSTYVDSAS